MEYTLEEYKRTVGKVFTTSDGNKYILSKSNVNFVYLRCALFRGGCKGTCKLNRERDLITPLNSHNHDSEAYKTELFALKTKCMTVARNSQMNLRKVFDDVTRDDPRACEISFSECESTMFRARKTLEPKIPQTALEFSDMITTTNFGKYYKFSVSVGNELGAVFFSEPMKDFLSQITNIQYDGTFFTVPIQFYQLWTIFISVGRHTLPAIHYLLTGKNQQLYQAILESISQNIPHFRPLASMSDWEDASRNAFRETYPQVKIYGCWFHFTQRIWAKTQKLGLVEGYRNKQEIENYIKQLMSIPFLPAALIIPTFNFIQVPENSEGIKLEKLKKYFKRRWINQISPEELSINDINITTNNGSESYHSKLKSNIRTSHPRIWSFIGVLNNIIQDVDNDVGRLCQGREISRPPKKNNLMNFERRCTLKQKLSNGDYNPWQFLEAISHTIGKSYFHCTLTSSDSEFSDNESADEGPTKENKCIVCLGQRTATWIFMPCRHACCCTRCSQRIKDLGQPCPICRSDIENTFQIFIN